MEQLFEHELWKAVPNGFNGYNMVSSNKSFPFLSNLNIVLPLMHSLRNISKQIDVQSLDHVNKSLAFHSNVFKECIYPLVQHVAKIKLDINSIEIWINRRMIMQLFYLLYKKNKLDSTLDRLLAISIAKCNEFESNIQCNGINNFNGFIINNIPMEILCHTLLYLSPINIRQIECVSYSFYNASQRQMTNIILDDKVSFEMMMSVTKYGAQKLIIYKPNTVTFLTKYTQIAQLSLSYYVLDRIYPYFASGLTAFWDNFKNIQRLTLYELEHVVESNNSLDDLLKTMVNGKYLKQTLRELTLLQLETYDEIIITPNTLKCFSHFTQLQLLYIGCFLALNEDLEDEEYINDNYFELQSKLNHITDITIECDRFSDPVTPSFLSIFFHSNVESLSFKFGDFRSDHILNTFIDNLDELQHGYNLYQFAHRLQNLKNVQKFEIFANPHLPNGGDWRVKPKELWLLPMIYNMNKLQTFIISQWSESYIFGDVHIDDLNASNNMLYKIIKCHVNCLKNICFKHEGDPCAEMSGLYEDSWMPLFAMNNVLKNAKNNTNIKQWAMNIFQKFEFQLEIDFAFDNIYYLEDMYLEQFDPLKLTLFPKVQCVLRSLRKLFKIYNVEYSIKLILNGCEFLKKIYMGQFKQAKLSDIGSNKRGIRKNECGMDLIDNEQFLITDFFAET